MALVKFDGSAYTRGFIFINHNPGNPLEYRVGKGMKKVGKIEKKVGRRAFTHGHPVLGATAYAEGVGHKGAGKILKFDAKHGK